MNANSSKHRLIVDSIQVYTANHPEIMAITESLDEPSIHGDKVWDASFVMMDFLNQFPLEAESRILEIGCGWGVLSCYLAKHYTGAITGLDADEAVKPYFDFHAAQNQVEPHFLAGTMKAMTQKTLRDYDVLIGCDICFWDSLKKDWQGVIKRARNAGVKEIYMTDPGRPPFWDLVEYAEKHFDGKVWSHEITTPYALEQYVLEIRYPD